MKVELKKLPGVEDVNGGLIFVESNRHIPFEIRRVYFIHDVPGNSFRGGHAHKTLEQLIVAAAGSFDVLVHDGNRQERFVLDKPDWGLYLPPLTWRKLENFSSGALCLVMASDFYCESDYCRDFDAFLGHTNALRDRPDP